MSDIERNMTDTGWICPHCYGDLDVWTESDDAIVRVRQLIPYFYGLWDEVDARYVAERIAQALDGDK